jgi:hypothetical protein
MAGTSWFSRTFARKSKGEKTKSDATNTGGVSSAAAGVGGGGTKTIGSSSGATGADEITRGVEALGTGSGSTATTASGSGTGRKMCVEDFEPLKLIGRGAFGALRCVAILFFFSRVSRLDEKFEYSYETSWKVSLGRVDEKLSSRR